MNKSALILLILVMGLVHTVGAAAPVASFTWTPVCGSTIQFNDTSTGNLTNWWWVFGGGHGSSPDKDPYIGFPLQDGTYTVTLTVKDNTGVSSTTSQTIVTTSPSPPIASFTAIPTSGTAPLTVQFTDTSSSPMCPLRQGEWGWEFGDGTRSNLQNPSHTFMHACNPQMGNGTYPVSLFVSNIALRGASTTKNIALVVPPSPVSFFTATPKSGPAPLTVQFTDTSSNNPTGWDWQFGDGTTSNLQNPPPHTYTLSGVYTVTMQASHPDDNICNPSNSVTTTITVLSPLAPGTTTSPTPTSNQTATTSPTTTTVITTTIASTIQPTEPTTRTTTPPTISISTPTSSRTPTSKVTLKTFTPYPTDTQTQPSPLGVEIGIMAMMIVAILVVKRK